MDTKIETTITINNQRITIGFSNKTKRYYKQAFGCNPLKDLEKVNTQTKKGLLKALTITYPQILWAMAKTSNPDIPKFADWHVSLGHYDILDYLDYLGEFLDNVGGERNG